MSGLRALDRIATVAVTAAVTSGIWLAADTELFRLKRVDPAPSGDTSASITERGQAEAPTSSGGMDSRPTTRLPTASTGRLVIPVEGVAASELVDTYSDSRGDGTRLHEAIDIMAPTGTPVIAAAGGTIEKIFQSEAGGLTVYVRSTDRETLYYYAHLDSYAPGLREGQVVAAGRELGSVGASGNASADAPHLHFAIMRTASNAQWWEPANPVNPYPILTGRSAAAAAGVSRP